ncbi:MAG: M48 family metallopeptidase [Pirellulales bacterium]
MAAAVATAESETAGFHWNRPSGQSLSAKEIEVMQGQLEQVFRGEIQRSKKSIAYAVGMSLVTCVMIVLPLIYVALIALAAYAVYYHGVEHVGMLAYGRGRGKIFVLLAYVAPMVIGAILVAFMIKPLFARPANQVRTRSLTRGGEPLLFAFVHRLCEIVGAPRPKRIDVDYELNASAGFRRGMLSFLGSDLVLTIGMPLAAGLSIREFAGVLAHEFGHFTQGGGMRVTYVARSINRWFARVVYERDEWDEWLENTAAEIDFRVGWILMLSQLFVMASRGILWVLMSIGNAVSGFMLRQMEYDADSYETRVAGSDAFASTTIRIRQLGAAYQGAQPLIMDLLGRGVFPDDLSKVVLKLAEDMPEKVARKLRENLKNETTGVFDTHPCDKDRIAAARREKAPGIIHAEGPASSLFVHCDALTRNVTWDLYCAMGARIKPDDMASVEELFNEQPAPAEVAQQGEVATIPLE